MVRLSRGRAREWQTGETGEEMCAMGTRRARERVRVWLGEASRKAGWDIRYYANAACPGAKNEQIDRHRSEEARLYYF